jgi:soluble lytic murein transglycosylase-like protein
MKSVVIALAVVCLSRVPASPPELVDAPPPRKSLNVKETLELIEASAEKHRVPANFVRSIVAAESNYNPSAVSSKGAIGLMQLMPETAEELGANPAIPEQNIDAGTRYLRILMDRYAKQRNPLQRVIAAYNAGPGNVDRYRGIPPFRETRSYVKRVMAYLQEFERPRKGVPITLAALIASH